MTRLFRPRVCAIALAVSLLTALLLGVPAAAAVEEMPTCNGIPATITEGVTDGPDVIEGTPDDDVIVGLGGRDVIYGNGGNDLICGGRGGDRIYGGDGNDTIFGQGGHDILKGGDGDDVIKAGRGNDRVRGQLGEDVARGGMGADVCTAETETNCEMDRRGPRPEEEWQPLVELYFPANQVRNALDIIDCESNGDPFAVGESKSGIEFWGLFQHHETYWPQRAINAGFPGETAFHPEANIKAAAQLWEKNGWSPWPWCSNWLGI